MNDINDGYRTVLLQKNSLCLLLFYMALASCCYYEKVRSTMCSAIASYVLKYIYSFSAAEPNNIDSEEKTSAEDFSYKDSSYGDSDDEDI